jgi:hypothetical protein
MDNPSNNDDMDEKVSGESKRTVKKWTEAEVQ